MKLDPEVKAKWLAELRSGRRAQGTCKLRTKDGHWCCLGVLCDVVAPGDWVLTQWGYTHQEMSGLPNMNLLHKVGLFPESASSLAALNDSGASFEQIAHVIEREY